MLDTGGVVKVTLRFTKSFLSWLHTHTLPEKGTEYEHLSRTIHNHKHVS